PIQEYGAGAADVVRPALDALAEVSPDFSIHPKLASSWKPVTPKEWHFTIRPGVTFHDGKPLTADDVVSTFELALGPNSAGLSAFETILSSGNVEKVNSTTVALHPDQLRAPAIGHLRPQPELLGQAKALSRWLARHVLRGPAADAPSPPGRERGHRARHSVHRDHSPEVKREPQDRQTAALRIS